MTYSINEILTEEDYSKALDRLEEIFDAIMGSEEGKELNHLSILIEEWEDKHYPM
jgi:HTH-type transcriptional regulator/antitoxin HigA